MITRADYKPCDETAGLLMLAVTLIHMHSTATMLLLKLVLIGLDVEAASHARIVAQPLRVTHACVRASRYVK